MLSSPNIGEDAATKNRQTITMRGISIFALPMIVVANIFYMFGLQTGLAENKPHDNLWFPGIQRSHNPTNIVGSPYDDFIRSKYCIDKSPCIAMLSASNHQGIRSEVNQVTLAKHSISDQDSSIIQKRILVREGYCAIYFCDVIIDFNKYNENRTMWLSDSGKHKVGPMPPHWNKVAALQRWFPHYDGILLMDMDSTWISFNHSIYDLYDETVTINYNGGGPELVMFKKHQISWAIVDSWWFFGTSPGKSRYILILVRLHMCCKVAHKLMSPQVAAMLNIHKIGDDKHKISICLGFGMLWYTLRRFLERCHMNACESFCIMHISFFS